jgi:drug/metabolite transporter (DMT)-like permease
MLIALIAIYFSSKKEESTNTPSGGKFILLAIFLGSGLVDVCIKISQEQFGSQVPFELLLVFIFGAAGVIGLAQLLIQKIKISFKDFLGGLSLGLLNFFSTYVLMSALSQPGFESSYVFAINNIGIILFNSAFASFFYKEKLSRINQFGILLALLAIAFIQLGK